MAVTPGLASAYLASGGRLICVKSGWTYQGYNPHATPTGPVVATVNGKPVVCARYFVLATRLVVVLPSAFIAGGSAAVTISVPGVTSGAIPVTNFAGQAINAPGVIPPAPALRTMKIGMNLFRPVPESSGRIFADITRNAGGWTIQNASPGQTVVTDARGYPQSLTGGSVACYCLVANCPGSIPAGNYLLRWSGTGLVWLADNLFRTMPVSISGQANGWYYAIVPIPANNPLIRVFVAPPIDGIELLPPGCYDPVALVPTRAFDPGFDAVAVGDTFRPMDGMPTNYNTATNVSDFKRELYYTDAAVANFPNALSINAMCEICNHYQKNLWLNIPEGTSQRAQYDLAKRVAGALRPGLMCSVARTNEIWNPIFTAYGYAGKIGAAAGLAGYPAVIYGAAQMASETHRIFRQVFGAEGRAGDLKCVLEWKFADGGDNIASLLSTYQKLSNGAIPDVYAVAPYIPAPACNQGQAALDACLGGSQAVDMLRPVDLLDFMHNALSPDSGIPWWFGVINRALAPYPGIELATYECGHNVYSGGVFANGVGALSADGGRYTQAHQDAWFGVCAGALRDPRFAALLTDYFGALQTAGVKRACYYSSIGAWNVSGMWPAVEYQGQPAEQAPALMAIQKWIASLVAGGA